MVDRVKPLKLENPASGGTESDIFPTSLNKNEDYVDARGLTIQNDSSDNETVILSRDSSDNMTFIDSANPTAVTLSDLVAGSGGLTEGSHEVLDTLKHVIAESCHQQITRSSGRISNITLWTDSGETTKIRELQITRSSGRISELVEIQYDASGVEKMRVTGTITRSSGKIDHIDWVEVVA